MFVTIFLGILNAKTGETFYTNAGHNPPLLIRQGEGTNSLEGVRNGMGGAIDNFVYPDVALKRMSGVLPNLYQAVVIQIL